MKVFSVTDLLRLTMAQGIPVGVLKAGSSFSASWTAFSLNTWKGIQERVSFNFYHVHLGVSCSPSTSLLNILPRADSYEHKTTANHEKTNAGWRQIGQSEMSGDKRLLNDDHSVSEQNRFMEDTSRLIYAKKKTPFKLCSSNMK